MFDNWYSCLFTLVLLFLLSKNDRSGSSPQGGFVCFSALLSCFQTKMIFFLDYVRVYPFSESRISSVRVKTWFRSKKCLRCKRRFVCFGMNFKSIIWFRVKLCLSARENARWMLKRKCFFFTESMCLIAEMESRTIYILQQFTTYSRPRSLITQILNAWMQRARTHSKMP